MVIFLEIEGVLSCKKNSGDKKNFYVNNDEGTGVSVVAFCPKAVLILNKLIEDFDIKIVITSNLRILGLKALRTLFFLNGIKRLPDDTILIGMKHKGKLIKLWLEQNKTDEKFYIIESKIKEVIDDFKMENIIGIWHGKGLTEANVAKIYRENPRGA